MLKWYHWLSPAHHLLALHARWVASAVGAELKAQCRDQKFVNEIFYSPVGLHEIIEIDSKLRKRYRGKMRWFMDATFLLESLIRIDMVPLSAKERCLDMLVARHMLIRTRVESGQFPGGGENPDLKELEEMMDVGFSVIQEDRLSQDPVYGE